MACVAQPPQERGHAEGDKVGSGADLRHTASEDSDVTPPEMTTKLGASWEKGAPASRLIRVDSFGLFSRQLWLYCVPLVMRGWRQPIDETSALDIPDSLKLSSSAQAIDDSWSREQGKGGKPSLPRAFVSLVWPTFLQGVVIAIVNGAINAFLRPYILRECILLLTQPLAGNVVRAVVLWASLFMSSLVEAWTGAAVTAICCDQAFTVFVAFSSRLLCSKCFALRRSDGAGVASLLGSDVVRTYEIARELGFLPLGIAAVIGGIVMLLLSVGVASIAGIICMFLILLITQKMASVAAGHQKRQSEAAAKRLAILEQIVEASKAVKFFSWEEPYLQMLDVARDEEMRHVRKIRWCNALSIQMGRISPILSAACTVACMVAFGMRLRAADIFATIAVFMALRLALIIVPQGWSSFKTIQVSFQRIQTFLELPDEAPREVLPEGSPLSLEITSVQLAWPTTEADKSTDKKKDAVVPTPATTPAPIVSGSLHVARGTLVAIVGPVGCGKSTLLAAMVGELRPLAGTARAQAELAYAPQQPQVICGTVRDNILLGRPFDAAALEAAIQAADLAHDLELFAGGLEAEIGERGVSLSGGQKQRISLARTLYGISPDALLILDDPIAAVDPLVGRRIMQGAVFAHKARGGTAIVALNQEAYLPRFDKIVTFVDGQLVEREPPSAPKWEAEVEVPALGPRQSTSITHHSEAVILQEVRTKGAMGNKVVLSFLKAIGAHLLVPFLVVGAAGYASMTIADVWLAQWTRAKDLDHSENLQNLGIYVTFVTGFAAGIMLAARLAVSGTTRASRLLHKECITTLLRAPLSWWDGTPKGRITSRFSSDLGQVDLRLGFMLDNLAQLTMNILAFCGVVAFVVPPMVVLIVFCFGVFGLLFTVVDCTNRELKRIAHQAMAPLLSNIGECTQMQRTARLLGTEAFFIKRNDFNTDAYNQVNWSSSILMQFLKFLATALAALISAGTTGWLIFYDRSDPERGTVAMTYSITIPYFMGMCCSIGALVKMLLTGLERLLEYKDLPQEPAWHRPSDPPPSKWPTVGKVEFDKVKLRYQPNLPLALNSVSFCIPGGSRVGVVGRTGSGKSSLVACLFRLHEIEGGEVRVDEVNIAGLGLRCLRRCLTVVPQDPILMAGTVRKNLDPFETTAEGHLRSALCRAELAATDKEAAVVLERTLEKGGSNLSCGERQLLCLARAAINGPSILVLDEPTSSADPATDAKLQVMIRKCFSCTVLCIAHRIQTVMDSDYMLVMRDGKVKEFGPPTEVYANPSGEFRQMCDLSGIHLKAGSLVHGMDGHARQGGAQRRS